VTISKLASAAQAFPASGIAAVLTAVIVAASSGPAAAADVRNGSALYAAHCAICHGANGVPVMPNAPNFRRVESLLKPDAQLFAAIRNGRGAMPGFYGVLKDRDILDVIAHLRTLN
jgi:cytochrome c6